MLTHRLYVVCRWHLHHFHLRLDEVSDAKTPVLISEPLQKQRAFLMLFLSIQVEWMPLYTDLFFILSFHNEAFIAHLFSIKAVCCVCVCARGCACGFITAVCFVHAIITVCISLWRYCSPGWCTMCLLSSSCKARVRWRRLVELESSKYYDIC